MNRYRRQRHRESRFRVGCARRLRARVYRCCRAAPRDNDRERKCDDQRHIQVRREGIGQVNQRDAADARQAQQREQRQQQRVKADIR